MKHLNNTIVKNYSKNISTDPFLKLITLEECEIDYTKFISEIAETFDSLSCDIADLNRMQLGFLQAAYPEKSKELKTLFMQEPNHLILKQYFEEFVSKLSKEKQDSYQSLETNRKRSIAKFIIEFETNNKVSIRRVSAGAFIQKSIQPDDIRARPRYFAETSSILTNNPHFNRLLEWISLQIKSINKSQTLHITLHQVENMATKHKPYFLPDGIHQDGVDYIVSALPLILENVITPTSTIYNKALETILETKLELGQGLFHDDRLYWHSVSETKVAENFEIGRRCSLGFDIECQI